MRIKPSTSFPHPVLSKGTGDYGNRTFSASLEVEEKPAIGFAIIKGTIAQDDPAIQSLIDSGDACTGLMITCIGTYFDKFVELPIGAITVDLSGGLVRGAVYIRGAIIATKNNVVLLSEYIDKEFPEEARKVNAGDFIALTEERFFEAGLEKMASFESIFKLKRQEDVAEGEFEVGLDSESIEILVSPSFHQFLSLVREDQMRDVLLSSLYLPVIMSVLDAMKNGEHTDRRWHDVISSKCRAEGIDVKNGDLSKSAQTLLNSPLMSLRSLLERMK
jgi:hypothetical protein